MSNQEKQADEILVLQSIFDKKLRIINSNQYEISIDYDLIQPIQINFNIQTTQIQHLPPITLIVQYHDDYPSEEQPSFLLSCFYYSHYQLAKLCQIIDQYPFNQEVCVYDWVDLIKSNLDYQWNFDPEQPNEKTDPRALNSYSNDSLDKIYEYLIEYNKEYAEKQFENHLQTCLICAETLPGKDCFRLHRCGHFYCRSCLNHYIQSTLNDGKFGERLVCPEGDCRQAILPTEVKEIVGDDKLYERYERITLEKGLAMMNDIIWCPRCRSAVLVNEDENDKLAACDTCRYTFCRRCRGIYHSQTLCRDQDLAEQIERARKKQQEQLLTTLARTNEKIQDSFDSRARFTKKFEEISIDFTKEIDLFEEVMNAERMSSLGTQQCPQCHVMIEKNGGCSHMHCTQCDLHFTWSVVPETTTQSVILNHATEFESLIDRIRHGVDLTKRFNEESTEDNRDFKLSITNQSTLGSAILKRVKVCPQQDCRKMNVKVSGDNWMICRECMNQYCFICGRAARNPEHFRGKCQRYTDN